MNCIHEHNVVLVSQSQAMLLTEKSLWYGEN